MKIPNNKEITTKEKLEQKEEKILYLQTEIEYLKKLKALPPNNGVEGSYSKQEKVIVIDELRAKYPLKTLLKIAEIPRSTYYEIRTRPDKDEKNREIMDLIEEIYHQYNGTYGYRRITLELRKRGVIVNHKKVLRLTRKMGLITIAKKN